MLHFGYNKNNLSEHKWTTHNHESVHEDRKKYSLDTNKLGGNISQRDSLWFPRGTAGEENHTDVFPDVFRLVYEKVCWCWLQESGKDLISRVGCDKVRGLYTHQLCGFRQIVQVCCVADHSLDWMSVWKLVDLVGAWKIIMIMNLRKNCFMFSSNGFPCRLICR